MVVLGGGVIEEMAPELIPQITEAFKELPLPSCTTAYRSRSTRR